MNDCQLQCTSNHTGEDTQVRTNAEFLDLARERAGLTSDYQLAQRLGITRQYVSKIRAETVPIPEPVADQLGELIGIDGGVVYAEMMAARAKRTDVKVFWERVARSLAATLAAVFIGVSVGVPDASARAANGSGYTLCEVKARRRRIAGRWLSVLFRTRAPAPGMA